jgi:hypothetical protein
MPQRNGEREAGWQLPSSVDDLIPATHPVRFVAAYVDSLDPLERHRVRSSSVKPRGSGSS